MRKWLLLALVLALGFGTLGGASAGPDDEWYVYLRARTSAGDTGQTGVFGTKPGASDGPDANDATVPVGGEVFITSVDLGAQHYYRDIRSPLDWNEVKVWNLKLWLSPTSAATQIQLAGWSVGLNGLLPVRLEAPQSVLYQFDAAVPGSSASPAFQWVFDGTTRRGLENAIDLRLVAGPAVPEPGNLVAMLCGLVSLGGLVRQRK